MSGKDARRKTGFVQRVRGYERALAVEVVRADDRTILLQYEGSDHRYRASRVEL